MTNPKRWVRKARRLHRKRENSSGSWFREILALNRASCLFRGNYFQPTLNLLRHKPRRSVDVCFDKSYGFVPNGLVYTDLYHADARCNAFLCARWLTFSGIDQDYTQIAQRLHGEASIGNFRFIFPLIITGFKPMSAKT